MTVEFSHWGREGGATIPHEGKRLRSESRIEAVIRAIEERNQEYAVITCRRDGLEQQRDGRVVRETYQLSLSNRIGRMGASIAGEIWVSIRVDDGTLGPQHLPNLLQSARTMSLRRQTWEVACD